ncbi:MAG TPA: thioredoxin family protein [Planctomycetaceae bacterium]|jgi:protocatechuate 3,4-dioxygenase beta subunit|nr:thioredoxin family protein [Planctomycetaceae bacterium]
MRRPLLLVLAAGTCLALHSLVACGAESADERAVISGQIVDPNGAAIPGARVQAVSPRVSVTTQSDTSGKFAFAVPMNSAPAWPRYDSGVSIIASDPAERTGMLWLPLDSSPLEPRKIRIAISPLIPVEVSVLDNDNRPVSGARVGAEINDVGSPVAETDKLGIATVRVPQRIRYVVVYAYKAGRGLDFQRPSGIQPGPKIGGKTVERVVLKLGPTGKRVTIRAKSDDGRPVAGLSLHPGALFKDQPEQCWLGRPSLSQLYATTTNADGIAHVDNLPAWITGNLTFVTDDKRFALRGFDWNAKKQTDGVVELTIPRLVPMTGRVQFGEGAPASGIAIEVSGGGASNMVPFRGRTISRADGSFTIDVCPDEAYLIGIDDQKWAAEALKGIIAKRGTPVENLKLTLRRPTRVHGRVAVGKGHTPVVGQYLMLQQLGTNRPQPSNSDVGSLKSPQSRWYDVPSRSRSVNTDHDGRYQFDVGPGEYTLKGPRQFALRQFRVTDEGELNFDFDLARPEMGPISLAVVDAASGRPVPHATISGIGDNRLWSNAPRDITADDMGQFRGERVLGRTLLCALSPDKKSAGFVEIGPDESGTAINLKPMGSALGQIVNARTQAPFTNAKVHYKAIIPRGLGFGDVVTDEKGNFELKSLVPGVKYEIELSRAARPVTVVTVGPSETKQLGKVIFDEQWFPSLQLQIAEALAFDPQQQYVDAQKEAGLFRQRIALMFIDPNSSPSRAFMKKIFDSPAVGVELEPYRQVVVDATSEKAKALAKALKITIAPGESLPQLVVRDEQGGPVATYNRNEIEVNAEVDEAKLIELLHRHANEPLDARLLLDGALAQAHQSKRRVLVVRASADRGDCRRMMRYFDASRSIWEKDYILVRIDFRWKNREEVMEEIEPDNRGGHPWLTILDAKATALITSNVAYPGNADEIEQFISMFKQTSQRLSDDDLWKLRIGLDAIPLIEGPSGEVRIGN